MKNFLDDFFNFEIHKSYNNIIIVSNYVDIKKPIYKYMSITDAFSTISNQIMYFSNVSNWVDKFENPLRYIENIEEIPSLNHQKLISNSIFGYCWTLNYDSDSLWRTENKEICIKTTIERLLCSINLKSFYLPKEYKDIVKERNWRVFGIDTFSLNYFIGKIRYVDVGNIGNALCDIKSTDYPCGYASFFLKRKEFQHENEIRILIGNGSNFNDKITKKYNLKFASNIFVPINDNNYIDCLYLHPKFNSQQVSMYKELFSKYISSTKIKKSNLYDEPYKKILIDKNNMIYKKDLVWYYAAGNSSTWNITDKKLYKRGERKCQINAPEPKDSINKYNNIE